jgi:hypothetical protein
MRIQEQTKKGAGCTFIGHVGHAGQPACKCSQGCVKIAGTSSSNLYAAEFMLYAFHFAHEMEAPVTIIMKRKLTNR